MKNSEIFITCNPHIGPFLAREVTSLGFPIIEESIKGVLTSGTYSDTMKLNLHLRTGNRVLFKVGDFEVREVNDLHKKANEIEWEKIIPSSGYFSVDSSIKHPNINDSRFPNLKLKDAIVDRIREKSGKRPNSGPYKDRVVVFLHWHNQRARIYIDTSGETISKHGYRKNPYKAPMIESLAAATIMASGWDSNVPFINPMCGSGTLAIEAALLSIEKPPGAFRNNYGFMHTKWYNEAEWKLIKEEALAQIKQEPKGPIIASDNNLRAIKASRENAKNAKVDRFIDFQLCDFKETEMPEGEGTIFLNPEYGERLGEIESLEDTYRDIGDFFKQKCSGKTGNVFTGNLDLAKRVGLRTSRKTIFFNGKIECRLLGYELYSGTKRINKD